jgi:flagellin
LSGTDTSASGTVSAYDGADALALGAVTTSAATGATASKTTIVTGRLDFTDAVLDSNFSIV